MMKFLMLSALAVMVFGNSASAKTLNLNDKVLIVYYSKTGNTKEVANQIQKITNGDIVEIEPVEAYPEDYRTLTTQAKKEINDGYKPALQTKVKNFAEYNVVFVGSPCWWGTVATPVSSFLSENNFAGKKVIPFMTHGGSGLGHSVADIKAMLPTAEVVDGRAFEGNDVKNANNEIAEWLKGLNND